MSNCSRRAFLEAGARLGAGALVLSQFAGCGAAPIDGNVTPANGTATLSFAQFPKLASVGGGVVVDAGGTLLVVIRTADTTAVGLSAVCTHEGCTVEYVGGNVPISCPCHGSTFNAAGSSLGGPARTSLRNYSATVGSDAVVVTLG
jgi:nitrite reductase/ring-hydroxylating ferredoxin subunit